MRTFLYKPVFLCTIALVLTCPARSQASRLDTQISTFMLNVTRKGSSITLMPGIGIGYDFRNPVSRPGWSVVPILFIAISIHKDLMTSLLFPAVVARYRYNFNNQLSIDANIGAGLLAAFSSYISQEDVDWLNRHFDDTILKVKDQYFPAPFCSLGFNYTFTNQMMAGIDMVAVYSISAQQVAPLVTMYTSFPIADSKRKLSRRR